MVGGGWGSGFGWEGVAREEEREVGEVSGSAEHFGFEGGDVLEETPAGLWVGVSGWDGWDGMGGMGWDGMRWGGKG